MATVGDAGWIRMRDLVIQAYTTTYMTRGGVERPKTKKRRQEEMAVANEVVRFAFDHAGYAEASGQLAPGGLFMVLLGEAGL